MVRIFQQNLLRVLLIKARVDYISRFQFFSIPTKFKKKNIFKRRNIGFVIILNLKIRVFMVTFKVFLETLDICYFVRYSDIFYIYKNSQIDIFLLTNFKYSQS